MKKTFLFLTLCLLAATASFAQFGSKNGCITVNFAPLSPQTCPYTVSVSVTAHNTLGNYDVSLIPQTMTLNPATTGTLCFNAPSGYTIVPGSWDVSVSNGTISFFVHNAGDPSTPAMLSIPNNCYTGSNCSTFWSRVSTNEFTIRPGCTVGGI